jgi:uncharacterized protein
MLFQTLKKLLLIYCLTQIAPISAFAKSTNETSCDSNKPCYTNRLVLENSPYLLQHAHNPVNWYPWSKLALDKAKRENKPIFLSIGYASCHWCHVMEKESFNNVDIARLLNEHFISIKVDREQRPDIDELYGNAVMLFQGQKGWPMSVFLTPDAKPFYAGTYYNYNEFKALILKLANDWNSDEDNVIRTATEILNRLLPNNSISNKTLQQDSKLGNKATKSLLSIVDNYNGGFGEASKFPHEPWLFLLLDNSYDALVKSDSKLALNTTLNKMAKGGIYDQLTGGFHRYTTDPYWKQPHFEKMLYNQAMLISIYLRSDSIHPDPILKKTAQHTIEFVLTEMSAPKGGFYAALDADSQGEEGYYYVWRKSELKNILNNEDSNFITEIFDIDEYGETDDGGNILYIATTLEEYSLDHNIPLIKLQKKLLIIRHKMAQARSNRVKPAVDKKIIMSWNGLMITALCESSVHLNNKNYLKIAISTANFIWNKMQNNMDNSFYRTHINNINSQQAQLDDYAFYLQALIKLYDIDGSQLWLDRAEIISSTMVELFWDKNKGGFFNMRVDLDAPLPIRAKSAFDMTLPSANSITAQMFIRLARRTGNDEYLDMAKSTLSVFSNEVEQTPSAYSSWLITLNEFFYGEKDMPVYAARGHIKIDAFMTEINDKEYDLTVIMDIDSNWHVNANKPLNKLLIPTLISVKNHTQWSITASQYPKPVLINLNFNNKPLHLYQNSNTIKIHLDQYDKYFNPDIELQLQACNDQLCIPPEKITIYPRLLTEIN